MGAAVLATFLLIGAWHGPGSSALLFGLWHGAWCLVFLALRFQPPPGWRSVAAAGAHTLVVLVPGVLLARAPDVATGLQTLLSAPWSGSDESRVVAVALWTLTLTASALLSGSWLAGEMFARYVPATHPWRPAMRSAAWSAAVVLLWMFPPTTDRDFLYFRF